MKKKEETSSNTTTKTKKKPSPTSGGVGGMGTCLNLDLHSGSAFVIDRLRHVNPASILKVSVEYNLSAQQVSGQEWIEIMEAIGSLPFVNTVSLSFRIPPCPQFPLRAFITLMEEAVSLETLNLLGIQFNDEDEDYEVDEMIQSFKESEELKNVHLSKYGPIRSYHGSSSSSSPDSGPGQINIDPLLLAISNLPNCKVLHVDHTDILSDLQIRNLVFGGSPFETIKIGPQDEKTWKNVLGNYFPLMGIPMANNPKLKELIVTQMMSHESLLGLARLLKTNSTLEKVSLLKLETMEFGEPLGSALAINTTLQSLELNIVARDRVLFRQNVGLLASSLGAARREENNNNAPQTTTTALVTLKIDCMGMILRNISLIMDPFLKILRHDNFVLQNLLINRNKFKEPLSEELRFYLKLNQLGRNYFLRHHTITHEEAAAAAAGTTGGPPPRARRLLALPPSKTTTTTKNNSNEKQEDDQPKKKTKELDFREQFANMLIQNRKDIRILHYFISRNPSILSIP